MLSEPESSLLTPKEWCERVLAALRQRKGGGPGAAYMEMMLTYLIDLDPRREEFDKLLARYIGDVGSGLAGAADLLQQSWQRAESATGAPPLTETLRTLGGVLDDARAPLAHLSIGPERVLFQPLAPVSSRTLNPTELRQESAARAALRGQVPPDAATAPGRYEPLMRALGVALAIEPEQSFEVYVTPRAIVVEGSAGYFAVFTRDQFAGPPAS
jgi:hypothetical protein